uniref:Uncharacterized protein n=2 Tax=Oryza meridionalis TaxID=40149 RepID=A0A0E0F1F9_9ORYZ
MESSIMFMCAFTIQNMILAFWPTSPTSTHLREEVPTLPENSDWDRKSEMEAWTIRVVYFIVFSFFLVSARFGSCAPYSEEGRALLRYSESERDKSTDSLSNLGEGKVIDRVLNLLLKEKMFSSETPSELKELGTISESVADGTGGFEQCRKCLAK